MEPSSQPFPAPAYAIGVDLGGTNLRIASVGIDGTIHERIALDTQIREGREQVIRDMCEAIGDLTRRMRDSTLLGIGIGVPGIINLSTGLIRQSPNLPGWNDFPVQADIERRLGTRVVLENDANAAALGEKWVGTGRNVSGLCMLTLGTGIGGGLILDGQIWHGKDGMGGEVGHMTIDPNGALCGCGNLGCIEAYASATAIVRMASVAIRAGRSPALMKAAAEVGEVTAEIVYIHAKEGDRVAREIFDRLGRSLGVAVANLINIFNLPLYVLAGGVSKAWDVFGAQVLEEVEKRSVVFRATQARIEVTALGQDAGLLGAAHLAMRAAQQNE